MNDKMHQKSNKCQVPSRKNNFTKSSQSCRNSCWRSFAIDKFDCCCVDFRDAQLSQLVFFCDLTLFLTFFRRLPCNRRTTRARTGRPRHWKARQKRGSTTTRSLRRHDLLKITISRAEPHLLLHVTHHLCHSLVGGGEGGHASDCGERVHGCLQHGLPVHGHARGRRVHAMAAL